MFNWNDVVAASRFQTKLWNITRFVVMQLDRAEYRHQEPTVLADRWLSAKLAATVAEVTAAMDAYQFDRALRAIREFAWEVLADEYIELVKGRLYAEGEGRDSACSTLATTLDALCRLLAPFIPYFAEECFSAIGEGSVHAQSWVTYAYTDSEALTDGEFLVALVSELRRYKHDHGIALNGPLGKVTVMVPHPIDDGGDAARTLNADLHWHTGPADLEQAITDIKFNMAVIGKTFRKDASAFMDAVKALLEEEIEHPPATIQVNGVEVAVPENAFSPVYSYMIEGEQVDVITVRDVIVTIQRSA
jgi:valyl-tRNA synthetase